MKIEFYEKEVKKAQAKFNKVFGAQPVCNLGERQAVIMTICWLGVLYLRIKRNPENSDLIKEFIRGRNIINKYFKHKGRRNDDVEHTFKREVGENTEALRNRAYTVTG